MNIMQWNRFDPLSVAKIALTWVTAALLLVVVSGCVTGPKVPQILQVPASQRVFLHAYAKGVQIYTCALNSTNQDTLVWKFKAPEATLFDDFGNVIGSHYTGPTWELDCDGSTASGEVRAHSNSPFPDAIPWLLVQVKPTGGPGQMQQVTYIQGVNTTGGTAPATMPGQVGEEIRVHYTAEYYFYREARINPSLRASAVESGQARQEVDLPVLPGN